MKKYWDDVEIGHSLVALTRPPVSRVQLAHFAAATDDFSALHLDDEFAKSAGFGSVFAHNLIVLGLSQDALKAFAHNMTIVSHSGTFLRLTWPGDILSARGVILRRYHKHDEYRIQFSLWVENQNSDLIMRGQATALLFKNAHDQTRHGREMPTVSQPAHEAFIERCERVLQQSQSHKSPLEKELA